VDSDKLLRQESPVEEKLLSEREQEAYNKYMHERGAPLAPSTAAKFFELYLNGHGCSEIQKLNPSFPLGLIVKARLDYEWDRARQDYILDLMKGIRTKVQQSQLEAIAFAADAMSTFHKLAGDKFKKFLQTGDASELGEYKFNFRNYKEFVEMLMKMTGQDSVKSKVSGEIYHHHQVEQVSAPEPMRYDDAKQTIKGFVIRKAEKK